jgi:hypothetical protein
VYLPEVASGNLLEAHCVCRQKEHAWHRCSQSAEPWTNHLKMLSAGSVYDHQAGYRLWTFHGADLDEELETINLSHVERAEQLRRRSPSASPRRHPCKMDRPPQTAAGRIAEGERSATEWPAPGQAQPAGAYSKGAAASGHRVLPWDEVPGASVGGPERLRHRRSQSAAMAGATLESWP